MNLKNYKNATTGYRKSIAMIVLKCCQHKNALNKTESGLQRASLHISSIDNTLKDQEL
jgi:hypothetical protein